MPTNKIESLEKDNNKKIEDKDYIEDKFETNQLSKQSERNLSPTVETMSSNNGFYILKG